VESDRKEVPSFTGSATVPVAFIGVSPMNLDVDTPLSKGEIPQVRLVGGTPTSAREIPHARDAPHSLLSDQN